MINNEQLIAALRNLSNADFQRQAWLASEGPVVSSFSEDVCQVFDDTGLTLALDAGKCPPELEEQAFLALQELDVAVRRVDQAAPPERLLRDPRVKEVREISGSVLALVAEDDDEEESQKPGSPPMGRGAGTRRDLVLRDPDRGRDRG